MSNVSAKEITTRMQLVDERGHEFLEKSFGRFQRPGSQLPVPHARGRTNRWNMGPGGVLSKLCPCPQF